MQRSQVFDGKADCVYVAADESQSDDNTFTRIDYAVLQCFLVTLASGATISVVVLAGCSSLGTKAGVLALAKNLVGELPVATDGEGVEVLIRVKGQGSRKLFPWKILEMDVVVDYRHPRPKKLVVFQGNSLNDTHFEIGGTVMRKRGEDATKVLLAICLSLASSAGTVTVAELLANETAWPFGKTERLTGQGNGLRGQDPDHKYIYGTVRRSFTLDEGWGLEVRSNPVSLRLKEGWTIDIR